MSLDTKELATLRAFETSIINELRAALSKTQKNIVILCYFPTYEKQFGALIEILRQRHNVITIACYAKSELAGKGHAHMSEVYFRLACQDGSMYYPKIDVAGIDLIITTDEIGYEKGQIDREFLSKSAKRIYLPHSLIEPTGTSCHVDYLAVPSSLVYDEICNNKTCKAQLLQIGYPKLDESITKYDYKPCNTIGYVPTLHYDRNELQDLNAVIGFDSNLIGWLLANTSSTILVRVHPFHFQNQHRTFSVLQLKFKNNQRVVFDTEMGSRFYDTIDFMITDASTTSFSYAFCTLRPCFFFMPYPLNGAIAHNAHHIGGIAHNFSELAELIRLREQTDWESRIRAFRDSVMYHLGKSAQILADKIDEILQE